MILDVPGARYRTLVSAGGTVSQAGRHYYDLTGKEPPRNGIDPNATPYRRRKRELVLRQDGSEVALRTYDPARQTWRLTRAGQIFYSNKKVRYVIKWPSHVDILRKNLTTYRREDYLPSTATALGQVEVKAPFSEER